MARKGDWVGEEEEETEVGRPTRVLTFKPEEEAERDGSEAEASGRPGDEGEEDSEGEEAEARL